MTVRECIKQMRKYGADRIFLWNGTEIRILETHCDPEYSYGKIKIINGRPVMRSIYCEIKPTKHTVHMDIVQDFCLYSPTAERNYFRSDEYIVKEREMNLFIKLNGGIDEYRTISVPYYMYADSCMLSATL